MIRFLSRAVAPRRESENSTGLEKTEMMAPNEACFALSGSKLPRNKAQASLRTPKGDGTVKDGSIGVRSRPGTECVAAFLYPRAGD